jgi:hypothetical protein
MLAQRTDRTLGSWRHTRIAVLGLTLVWSAHGCGQGGDRGPTSQMKPAVNPSSSPLDPNDKGKGLIPPPLQKGARR